MRESYKYLYVNKRTFGKLKHEIPQVKCSDLSCASKFNGVDLLVCPMVGNGEMIQSNENICNICPIESNCDYSISLKRMEEQNG
jgi:hypothetical protein